MKKMLFVSHYPFYGGPQNRARVLAGPLQNAGWDTTVVLPTEPGNALERLTVDGVRVLTMPLGRLRAVRDLRTHGRWLREYHRDVKRIRHVIREEAIDLVVIAGLANAQAAIAAQLEKRALIWQILDTRTPNALVKLTMPLVRRFADAVMTTGTTVATKHAGLSALGDRVFPFYSPVDLERFAPRRESDRAILENIGLSRGRLTIGVVANITPQKGIENFIVMAEVVGAVRPDVQFLVVGSAMETHRAYEDAINEQLKRTRVFESGRLKLVDPGADVPLWLRTFDLFVLSSADRSEGIPTAVLEAMATGVPVVAVDVGGVREVVDTGRTGLVVEEARFLAPAVIEVLGDRVRLDDMRCASRAQAVERFSTGKCLATHLAAFNTAVSHREQR